MLSVCIIRRVAGRSVLFIGSRYGRESDYIGGRRKDFRIHRSKTIVLGYRINNGISLIGRCVLPPQLSTQFFTVKLFSSLA